MFFPVTEDDVDHVRSEGGRLRALHRCRNHEAAEFGAVESEGSGFVVDLGSAHVVGRVAPDAVLLLALAPVVIELPGRALGLPWEGGSIQPYLPGDLVGDCLVRQLVIGTTNRGKVRQVVGALSSLADLECVPIDLVRQDLPVVSEIGASAEDVAAVKAVAYSTAIDEPVLSLDHWLRFPEASADDQPLARVRRIPGHDDSGADDEQIIAHYSRLCERYGGHLTAEWQLGIAYADAAEVSRMTVVVQRRLVPVPSSTRMPGLPLSALQIDLETGKYISEHEAEDERSLWKRVYGPEFAHFVADCIGHSGTPT